VNPFRKTGEPQTGANLLHNVPSLTCPPRMGQSVPESPRRICIRFVFHRFGVDPTLIDQPRCITLHFFWQPPLCLAAPKWRKSSIR
jgi:hypothetical protein